MDSRPSRERGWSRANLDSTRERHVTTTTTGRAAAGASLLIALGIGLAGCGGDDAATGNGEYFAEDGDDLTSVVIDGNSLTYTRIQCEGENDGTSVGELNDDRTESSVTISSNDANPSKWDEPDTFTRQDAGEAKSQFDQQCADAARASEESDAKRENEQQAVDTKRTEIRTKLDSMTTAEMAECLGQTDEEFEVTEQKAAGPGGTPEQVKEGLVSVFEQSGCLDN